MALVKCKEDGKKGSTFAGIMVVVIIGIALLLAGIFIYSQNEKEQTKQNLETLLNTNPSYVQIAEAKSEAAKEHYEYLLWGATNGYPEYQFALATNALYETQQTNVAIYWLHKAADQNYQPAKELLSKLE